MIPRGLGVVAEMAHGTRGQLARGVVGVQKITVPGESSGRRSGLFGGRSPMRARASLFCGVTHIDRGSVFASLATYRDERREPTRGRTRSRDGAGRQFHV